MFLDHHSCLSQVWAQLKPQWCSSRSCCVICRFDLRGKQRSVYPQRILIDVSFPLCVICSVRDRSGLSASLPLRLHSQAWSEEDCSLLYTGPLQALSLYHSFFFNPLLSLSFSIQLSLSLFLSLSLSFSLSLKISISQNSTIAMNWIVNWIRLVFADNSNNRIKQFNESVSCWVYSGTDEA